MSKLNITITRQIISDETVMLALEITISRQTNGDKTIMPTLEIIITRQLSLGKDNPNHSTVWKLRGSSAAISYTLWVHDRRGEIILMVHDRRDHDLYLYYYIFH